MVVKTKQLTNRSIYVYLPTLQMANEWKALAEKSNIPISRFVTEHVENSLKQEDEKKNYVSRVELLKRIREKDEEIAKLTQDVRLHKTLAEKLDKELKHYRAQPFLSGNGDADDDNDNDDDKHFQGKRTFDKELVQLLRTSKVVDSDHILRQLGINPRDTELAKAVNRQLLILKKYDVIEPTPRGWRWITE